jgi:hypothetical protein
MVSNNCSASSRNAGDRRLPDVARGRVAALGAQLRMLKAQILQEAPFI